jgi:beta-glucosidase-like glycosyl hydrolase
LNASDWRSWAAFSSDEQRALNNAHGFRADMTPIGLAARGPVLNIGGAHPLWGRNHNSPGEDRYLIGVYGTQAVRGIQEGHVGEDLGTAPGGKPYVKILSELKHFAAYNVENNRFAFVDNVTWFDMQDTWLPAFEATIRDSSPHGLMCSYPAARFDGLDTAVPFCASRNFSTLARSWGFGGGTFDGPGGFIESDCGALQNIQEKHNYTATLPEAAAVALIDGRTDINCGTVYDSGNSPLNQALAAGLVAKSDLTSSAVRTTSSLMMAGAFDSPWTEQPLTSYTVDSHFGLQSTLQVSQDMARRGFVLLQNSNATLPLSSSQVGSIAIIGPMGNTTSLSGDYFDHQCPGGGNDCIPTIFDTLVARYPAASVTYVSGCDAVKCDSLPGLADAVSAAQAADVVILTVGDTTEQAHEGSDRGSITLTGQSGQLVSAVLAVAKRSVMVVITGETLALENYTNATDAILAGFYPGPRAAAALWDVIFAEDASGAPLDNLFGIAPFTWYAANYTDLVPPGQFKVTPGPTLGLTYRWFTGHPVFPFGTFNAYTTFNITTGASNANEQPLRMAASQDTELQSQNVTVKVTNTGTRDAAAVVMLWSSAQDLAVHATEPEPVETIAQAHERLGLASPRQELSQLPHRDCPDRTPTPLPSLVGFDRVLVPRGGSVEVTITVLARSMQLAACDGTRQLMSGTYKLEASIGHLASTHAATLAVSE